MKKKTNEEIDLDSMDFDGGFDTDFDFGEGKANKPKTTREAVTASLKDNVKGFTDEIVSDPAKTAKDLVEKSLPNSIRSEYYDVKDAYSTLKDEVRKATADVRKAGSGTIKNIENLLPQDSKLRKVTDKLKSFLGDNSSYEAEAQQSAEQKKNLEIQGAILEALGNITPDARSTAIKEQIANNRAKSHQELMSTQTANSQKLLDFNYTVSNSYYRKSLELQYKSYYTGREHLALIKTSFDTFKNQFESIVKNTALPEVVKIRSSEALKATMMNRSLDGITDVVYNNFSPLGAFKTKATNKIRMMKDDFVDGLNTGSDLAESASMFKDMEEMGFTKSKMAGGMLAGGFKSIVGRQIASKLEKDKGFKNKAFDFKNAINNPSKAILDKSEKLRNSDMPGAEMMSNFLYELGNMFKADDPRSLYTFKKEDPEDPAIFNFRTQNSIVKVIPNLLSKIYGEIRTLRTGGEPEDNEITWNNTTDKFESKSQILQGIQTKVRKSVSDKMGYGLTNMLDRIDPKKKLSPDEQTLVMSSLVKYLQENKDVTPLGLIKGDKSFISYLPEDLAKKVKRPLTKIVASSKNDNYTYDDVKYNLSSILNSTPNLFKEVEELYKSGNKNIAESLGLLVTDNVRNTSFLDRNGIFSYIQNAIKEHGVGNIKQDITQTDELAKYSGTMTNAEKERALRKERMKRMHKSRSIEDIIQDGKTNIANNNKKFRDKINIESDFQTFGDSMNKVYNSSMEENFNTASDKIKDVTKTMENSTTGQYVKATADVARKEANKLYKSGLEATLDAINAVEKSKTKEEIQINLVKAKKSKSYNWLKKRKDALIDTITSSTVYTTVSKEYKNQQAKLEKHMKERGLDKELTTLKNKLNYEDLTKLVTTFEEEAKTFVETNKKKSIKNIVDSATSSVNGVYKDASSIVSETYDDVISGKIPMKRYGVGSLSPSEYGKMSTVKAINSWGYSPEDSKAKKDELKTLDPIEENKLREFFFRSTAYTSGLVTDFTEYAKSFGFKTNDDAVNKMNFVDGLNKLAKKEVDKAEEKVKETIVDHFKLSKLNKEEEDAYRFEFYTSPEYKSGAMTDFNKWLKDKGLRAHSSVDLSITGILRKTREWDKKIFKAMVMTPIKAIAKSPWAAGKALRAGGKVAKPFAKLAGYGLDGVASLFGLGFMGVDDNRFIKSGKDKVKDILNNRKLSKGVNAPSSGLQQPVKQHMKNLHKINNWGYTPEDSYNRSVDYKNTTPEERFVKAYRKQYNIPDDVNVDVPYEEQDSRNTTQKMLNKTRGSQSGIIKGFGTGLGKLLKGSRIAGSGLFKAGKKANDKFDYRILNPFSKLAKKETMTPEEFMDDYREKEKDRNSVVSKRYNGNKAKLKPYLKQPVDKDGDKPKVKAYNDSDGDGNRDGDWRDRLKSLVKRKEPVSNNPTPTPSKEESKDNPLMKYLLPAIMALVGSSGKMLAGILGIIPGIKPLLGLVTSGIEGLSTISTKIASGVMTGIKFLGKIPSLITGLGGKISALGLGIKSLASSALETASGVLSKGKELAGAALDKVKTVASNITPDTVKSYFGRLKEAIVKKLGKKAGGKVLLTLGAKIASRAVPIAGAALLAYDVTMIAKDMIQNNTSLQGAISKQILGFDLFDPDAPALDEDGTPIQPDEQYSSDDMASTNSASDNGETDEGGGFINSMFNKAKGVYQATKEKGGNAWDAIKNTATTAVNWGKEAIGGLVSSIPLPNGNGSWQALKDTIVSASRAAGVDEKLMAVMGAIESGFNYTVKAGTSSATGIYQFISDTWKSMVSKYGGKYGIAPGTPPTDPRANALMGAEYLKENMSALKGTVNRDLTYTDAYMAHFLGAGGAKKFLKEMEKDPGQIGANLFSSEANSNANIFYVNGDRSKPRTLGDIYNLLTSKINSKSREFNIDTTGTMSAPQVPTTTSGDNSVSNSSGSQPVTSNVTTSTSSNTASSVSTPTPVNTMTPTVQPQSVSPVSNMSSSNFGDEASKALTGISSTLLKSLEVQMKMAEYLDKISQNSSRDISSDIKGKVNDITNANKAPSEPINSHSMSEVSVGLKRKVY